MNRIYHLHQSICIKTFQDQVTGEVSVYQDIMNQPITSVFGLYGLVGLCLSKERTTIVLLKSDMRERGLFTTTIPFWTNEKHNFALENWWKIVGDCNFDSVLLYIIILNICYYYYYHYYDYAAVIFLYKKLQTNSCHCHLLQPNQQRVTIWNKNSCKM